MPRCVEDVVKESEGLLTRDDAEQIFLTIEGRYQTLNKLAGKNVAELPAGFEAYVGLPWKEYAKLSPEARLQEISKASFAEKLTEKKEALRRQYKQARAAISGEVQLARHSAQAGRTRMESLIDFMVGNPGGKGEMQSVQSHYKGILGEFMARMWSGLEGYLTWHGFKISEAQESALVREIFKPGSTDDAAAKALGESWRNVSDDLRGRLNGAGADIGKIDGYLPQAWERMKTLTFGLSGKEVRAFLLGGKEQKFAVKAKAKGAWVDFVLPLIDRENPRYINRETGEFFSDMEMRGFLGAAWDTITTGGASKTPEGRSGVASMRSRLEAERQLHFRDADTFLQANRAFGSADVLTGIVQVVHQRGKVLAMMEKFGPNANTGFATLHAQARHMDSLGPSMFFDKKSGFAETLFKEMAGISTVPESTAADLVARISTNKRQWMTFAKLGSAFLSQVNDLATFTAISMKNGMGAGEAIKTAARFLNPLNEADRVAARRLGLAVESVPQEVMSRYADTLSGASLASKGANLVISASFMKYWTDALKTGFHALVGQHLAMSRGVPFEQLGGSFRQMLQRHGIGLEEWEVIRQTEPVEVGGRQIIPPSSIADPVVSRKVFGMFADEADVAVLSPDFKERAIAKGDTRPGTPWGEFRRDLLLFRMFSVGMVSKVLPRIIASAPAGSRYSRATVATSFAVGSILAGGLSYQLKEISKGRNPRDITEPEFWAAAAAQSGGFGIYGDFFFTDYNRFGGGLAGTILGPFWGGTAGDVLKLTAGNVRQTLAGEEADVGAEVIRFAKNNLIPNLWYTRAALDHVLFYRLQEMANPGYLDRMQSRIERENEQSLWWDPHQVVPAGPPDLTKAVQFGN